MMAPTLASLRQRLADPTPLIAVELRPPRRDLDGVRAMEAWIDTYHAVQRLSTVDTVVFLTDNAVGASEEENLAHLTKNLGQDAQRERIMPFLTLKHSLDYCLRYADRLQVERFPGAVVLGGDKHDGVPRCLPHAYELRALIRRDRAGLLLGGWANPHRDPAQQVELLVAHAGSLDFALMQVASHLDRGPVEAFANELARRRVSLPIFAGVFYYRSARLETLRELAKFMPVPVDALAAEFSVGAGPIGVAARTLHWLAQTGFTRFYLSNLETGRAARRLAEVAIAAELPAPAGLPRPRPTAARS